MKLLGCVVALALAVCFAARAGEEGPFKTDKEKIGYAIGLDIGERMKQQGVHEEVDFNAMLKGLQDGSTDAKHQLTDEELQKVMQAFNQKMQAKMLAMREKDAEKAKVAGEKNIKEGEAFLAENAKKEGVKTTASGLQYVVLKEGTGASPKPTDQVETHYKGTLIDGTEFDSSYKRNQTATFGLNQVIAGWTEGLQLMKVGGKLKLFVPSKLAYGEQGRPPQIMPNSTLVFEIELISIK